MDRILVVIVAVGILILGNVIWAAETNVASTNVAATNATNGVAIGSTNSGAPPAVSDAELQARAKEVLWMILGFWIVAILGALAVAGFALYGAYQKFGKSGMAVVAVILILGLWMFGSLLLSF